LPLAVFCCEAEWILPTGLSAANTPHRRRRRCLLPFCLGARLGLHTTLGSSFSSSCPPWEPRPAASSPPSESHLTALAAKCRLQGALSFTQVDLLGNEQVPETIFPTNSFLAISINNVPHPLDHLPSNPTVRSLDICIWEADAVVRGKKQVRTLDDLLSNSCTACLAFRASRVQLVAQDTSHPFHILLDGELYGPFTRVKIFPCQFPGLESNFPVFPIATTMPCS